MKITNRIRDKVVELRAQGLSYPKIAKATKISRYSAMKIVKEWQVEDKPLEARILKPALNPRIKLIYFGDDTSNWAKCIVRVDRNYPLNSVVQVKKVEGDEPLWRLA